MATYHGKSGKAVFSGAVASVLAWTLSAIGDIAESTVMGLTWKTFKAGFRDLTATIECNAMTEGTTKVGTNADLELYIDGSNYFDVSTAICTEQTETVNLNDVGKVSYSFVSDDVDAYEYV